MVFIKLLRGIQLKLEDILNNPKESNLSLSLDGSKIAGYLKFL